MEKSKSVSSFIRVLRDANSGNQRNVNSSTVKKMSVFYTKWNLGEIKLKQTYSQIKKKINKNFIFFIPHPLYLLLDLRQCRRI